MGISLWNNLGSRNTTLRLRDAVNPRAQAVIAGMRYKRKLLLLTVLMVLMTLAHYLFPGHPRMVALYNNYLFRPYQSLRNLLFGFIPFSVGDVLYLLAFLALLTVLVRWVYFMVRLRTHRHYLAQSLLNTVITFATVYLLFFIGWGGNYYKPSLTEYWKLNLPQATDNKALAAYDSFLIARINSLAPAYQATGFRDVGERAMAFYQRYTDSRTSLHGLNAKSSLYGYFMQYLGIQGYYNPFTGEAQVNKFLPSFMLPFVVCHEMAHQSGIAAEDDANLLSYALCTTAPDADFKYSGYFNLWLYTQNRVRQEDTTLASALMKTLNPISRAQLDTLRAIRRRYRSSLSEVSGSIYDSYLRMHHQKDGIESYYNVALSALAWERKAHQQAILRIP